MTASNKRIQEALDYCHYAKIRRTLEDCRNELCLMCGKYKEKHLGKCDGCRWKEGYDE